MIVDDFVKALAVHTAYNAGRRDGTNAMLGVLFAIRNLAKEHDGDWLRALVEYDVCDQFPDVRDPSFLQVLQRVDGIYDDSIPDTLTNGATFCVWKGRAGGERCAQIGNLIFYK